MKPDLKVLLVDDDPATLQVHQMVLEEAGISVVCTTSGRTAIQQIEQQDVGLVITDLAMPEVDGFAVLKAAARLPEVEVIVITASDDVQAVVRAMQQGALDYLQKPVDHDLLAVTTRKALTARRDKLERSVYRAALDVFAQSMSNLPQSIACALSDALDVDATGVFVVGEGADLTPLVIDGPLPSVPDELLELAIEERSVLLETRDQHRFLVHPLAWEGKVHGALVCSAPVPARAGFDARDVEVAGILAAQLSLALYNQELADVASTASIQLDRVRQGIEEDDVLARAGTAAVAAIFHVEDHLKYMAALVGDAPNGPELLAALLKARQTVAGVVRMVREPKGNTLTSASGIIERAMSMCGSPPSKMGVEIDDFALVVNANQAARALASIIDNAVEATTNTPDGEIQLSVRRQGSTGIFAVWDNGPGMDQATLRACTQPFFTTKPEGVGLGLHIASELLDQLGGRLELASRRGKGTMATMSFGGAQSLGEDEISVI